MIKRTTPHQNQKKIFTSQDQVDEWKKETLIEKFKQKNGDSNGD